ncbi:MAG: ABC transporter permease [Cyclobacteriaceae bacterium]
MNKVWIIIQREFLIRVTKKSFLVSTILVPLIFPAIMAGMIYMMVEGASSEGPEKVMVVDEDRRLDLDSAKKFEFTYFEGSLDQAKEVFAQSKDFALLYIPKFDLEKPEGFILYTQNNPGLEKTSALKDILSDRMRDLKLEAYQIESSVLKSLKSSVSFEERTLSETGEESESSTGLLYGLGMAMGIIIYMLVLLYGIQIMQGVIEEKSSKIVEIIVSSVKPFQMMLGKIVGIASVGMLQFIIWIALITFVTSSVTAYFGLNSPNKQITEQVTKSIGEEAMEQAGGMEKAQKMVQRVWDLPLVTMASVFLFYFIGGYLMYGALFAAVGASVETQQEAQQFQFPVTLPLLIGYLGLFTFILPDPHSSVSFWLSVIPFTSPVAMVGRIAFGVPAWELALSMVLLIAGFFLTTWLAGRIFRIGILMSGTKVTWKVLIRWATAKG